MRAATGWIGLGFAGLAIAWSGASAQAPHARDCGPAAIGTSRRMVVDTKGGPRFGHQQYPGPEVLRPGEVVLTFDDGPHRALTRPILDALDQHCAKATFFMVGQRALTYPEIVRDVASRGHTIATHTWTHQKLASLSFEGARNEIELGISAVQRALGTPAAPFFRFPYLSDPQSSTRHLRERNTAIFSIDVDSYDFRTRSPTAVIRNVMQQLSRKGRGIILFHDIQPSTAGAIGALLTELKSKGYKVVHLVPSAGQTTLAEYDGRIRTNFSGRRIAEASIPVSRRGIVSPAWEVSVYRGPFAQDPSRPAVAPGAGRPADRPAAARRSADDNWMSSIFRGW